MLLHPEFLRWGKMVFVLVLITLLIDHGVAAPKQRPGQNKHEMIMDILSDSVMLDLMMDHIASDTTRSAVMLNRLIYYAVGDSLRMERLTEKWLENKHMKALIVSHIQQKK